MVFVNDRIRRPAVAYPDTLVGTDSHTTMVNGLGVLGWGVGGIEAEAAMLGQPMSMLIPQVIGFKLDWRAARGRDRNRPRADRDRDAAQARRRRQVRRVLRRRSGTACRWPTARRSGTCRPSSARPARSSRSTPRRCATSSSAAARRSRSSWSRPTPRPTACGTTRTRRSRPTPTCCTSTCRRCVPSIAGPKRPQDRVSLTESKSRVRARRSGLPAAPTARRTRRSPTRSRPATRSRPTSTAASRPRPS